MTEGVVTYSSNDTRPMQTSWDFFYWNETLTNDEGQSLQVCMERYGVGGWYSKDQDMVAALIFLSAGRTAADSWLLGIKHFDDDEQATARLYEEDPQNYRVLLTSKLGAQITERLAKIAFEEV